jgi:hypothetical protein
MKKGSSHTGLVAAILNFPETETVRLQFKPFAVAAPV